MSTTPSQSSGVPLRITIPPDLARVAEVRQWVEEVAEGWLSERRLFDLQVTVSEATANAVEHAASAVELAAWVLPDRLIVEITNDGVFQPGLYKDHTGRRRGLGLPLMVSLADQVHVSRLESGKTQVSLTFFLDGYREPVQEIAASALAGEQTLHEVQDRYKSLVDLSPDAITVEIDGRYIFANPAAARLFGVRSSQELLGGNVLDHIASEDREVMRRRTGEALSGAAPAPGEVRLLRPDGTHVTVETRGSRVEFGGRLARQVVYRDLTERKRADEDLRASRATFAELVERSPFGIYVVDSQFSIAFMNAGSQNAAFRNVRPLIGRPFNEAMHILWPHDVAEEIIGHFRHTLETGEPYYSPRFTNPRNDVGVVESYEWELQRLALPDGQWGVICYYFDSTDLRTAEAALKESEAKYRNIVETAGEGIVIAEPSGPYTYVNERMAAMLGYEVGELVGKSSADFTFTGWLPEVTKARALLASGEATSGEFKFRRKDGSALWSLYNAVPIRDDDGRHVANLALHIDITERKRAEEERDQSRGQLSFLLELSDALLAIEDPLEIGAAAARVLAERLSADRVFYGEITKENGVETLVIRRDYHAPGVSSLTGRFPFKEFSHTDYDNYRAGRTVWSANVQTDAREPSQREAYRAADTAAFIGVPLVKREELVSVLGVLQRRPRQWTPEEIRLAEQTVDRTWQAIHRARAEEDLREREELFHSLFANIAEAFFIADVVVDETGKPIDYRIIEANSAMETQTGVPPEKFIGNTALSMYPDFDPFWVDTYGRVALTGDPAHFDNYVPQQDRHYEGSAYQVRPGRFAAIFTDITERRQTEEALRESGSRLRQQWEELRLIYESAPAGLALLDRELRYVRVNERLAEINGVPAADHIGRTVREVIPEFADEVERLLSPVFETGEPVVDLELKGETAAQPGVERAWIERWVPIRGEDGRVELLSAVVLEVTERIEREREREEFLAKQRQLNQELAVANEALVLSNVALHEGEERYRQLAKENERLYRQQLAIAEGLQLALLDIPSQIGHVKLGHIYRSATEAAHVGGDFYDVFEVKGGGIAVLIGDVAGHGIQAARTATLVKDVVHAFAHQSLRTHEVLRRTNGLLIEKELPGFVTLFLGIIDPETGHLRYSCAGHPESLLRRASGEVERLGSGTSPLGVYPDAVWKPHAIDLEAGDILVLNTDGVIEARRNGQFFGEKRLDSVVKRRPASPERLPKAILDQVLAFSEGSLHDDVAILAVMLTDKGNGGRAKAKPFKQEKLLGS